MVRSFELKMEHKARLKKERMLPETKEETKAAGSTSNSAVDEIDQLEIIRDQPKPSASEGPLSEANREIYMGRSSFRMEKEPIFDSILLNMVLGNSVNLKKKARIKIKDSCVLMGVIDEQGILEEGEIFVRI